MEMMLFLFGIMFIISVQPMLMVSMLMLIVILYSMMMYNILSGYWFGYLLVMVMLSGMMVVFTYMVSLIPNESFESYNVFYVLLILVMLMLGFEVFFYKFDFFHMSLSLWLSYFSVFTIFMVVFLLIMMLVVVWLSSMDEGSIRIYLGAWVKG